MAAPHEQPLTDYLLLWLWRADTAWRLPPALSLNQVSAQ